MTPRRVFTLVPKSEGVPMMRNIVAVIIVTVVAPFACADDKEKAIAKDKKALQGVWLVDAAYQDGKEVPRDDREKEEYCLYAVKVADDQFQVAWLRNKTEYGNLVPFSLNPGASPKVLEWQNGDRKAGVAYAIDGDKLTICFH